MTQLGIKELRSLAECERAMDRGDVPYTTLQGCRVAMHPETMAALGLTAGQTISQETFGAVLRLDLERCQQEVAYANGLKLVEEEG